MRALASDENSVSLRHSSRKLPLKLSINSAGIVRSVVLHRFSGGNVVPLDMCLLAPFEYRHAGHLCAVVGDDCFGFTALGDDAVQLPDKTMTRQRCVCNQTQAFKG